MLRYALFFMLFTAVLAKYEIYDGHAVYRVSVKTEKHAQILHNLEIHNNLDFWQRAAPGHEAIVLVAKQLRLLVETTLLFNGLTYTVEVENVKPYLDRENDLLSDAAKRSRVLSSSGRLTLDKIHTYEEVEAYMDDLARTYPKLVTVVTAGQSFEKRPIRYLKISTTNFQDSTKPVVFVQSLLHAREWVTLPASLYAIQKLVVNVTESDLVDRIDWIILPIANPDGYIASHGEERFWRKNRATGYAPLDVCTGVDLNRNFDFMWGTQSSDIVCTEIFHGRSAFSEPETQAVKTIFDQYKSRMQLFIDIHSYGSLILYGYGTEELPPNALNLHLNGINMAQAIDAVKMSHNRDYRVGNSAMVLYKNSGTTPDYAQSIGVPLSYTYELPASRLGFHVLGFLVDPDFIEQAGYETWEGIRTGASLICYTIVVVLNIFLCVYGKNEEYKGFKIYNVELVTEEQQNNFSLLKSDEIDFLRKPSFKYGVIGKAMVPLSEVHWFEEKLHELGVERNIEIEDLYQYMLQQDTNLKQNNEASFDFDGYYRYDKILAYMQSIEARYQNSTDIEITLLEVETTDENRTLAYLKLGKANSNNSAIIIEAAINPREWITVPAALNVVEKVIAERRLLDHYDWIIIPVLNPDGYEYTHTNLRFWQKNRSTRSNLGVICPGVNINRNFDIDWLISDSSSSPCSHLYGGTEAFSEPEARFIRSIHQEYRDRTRLYISLQNSGGFIAYPWQYERAASGMFRQHYLLGLQMANAIGGSNLDIAALAYGDRASGTSTDYLTMNSVLYAFNVDVEGSGRDNVEIPEAEIRNVVDKVWSAIKVAADSFLN
ncbi:unnamed protein product [Leptosia nina]|uniref:Peptidase M14 domain-containing protein n=1 Tax=Leptosia nina TaxID=320188 RepID=A0AAV1IZ72_9NEOP